MKAQKLNFESLTFDAPNGMDLEGYSVVDFFTPDGEYLGRDQHGVGIAEYETDTDTEAEAEAEAEAEGREAYTVYHYGFPPMVIFGREKLVEWIDAIHRTVGIHSVVSASGVRHTVVVAWINGEDGAWRLCPPLPESATDDE